jgi:iron complex outermembrane receptor protein
MGRLRIIDLILLSVIALLSHQAFAEDSNTLKDLVGTQIYSASKKEEDLYRSPSAAFVISADDIKRLGVRHVADALRSVPGLQVAKITSNKWMVASRGFGEQFSNKLLVLVDGRPIYTSLFSGVLWYQEDVPIVDIAQVEVIRGPGATLWGANAVNGVINIITKSTRTTLGTRINTTFGTTDKGELQEIIEAQTGKAVKDVGTIRATLKGRNDPSYSSAQHLEDYDDSWQNGSINFRVDSEPNTEKSYKITGSAFNADSNQTYTYPSLSAPFSIRDQGKETSKGGHIYGELTNELDATSSLTLSSYLDYTDWHYAGYNPSFVDGSLEAQYDFNIFDNWKTITGAGYKFTADKVRDSAYLITSPSSSTAQFGNAFIQTKIPLITNEVFGTIGTKIESSTYDDFNLSPSAKLSWEPNPLLMTWLSWSKAYRTPSRNTFNLTTYSRGTPAGYVGIIPSEQFKSEGVEAFEGGLRVNPIPGLQVDTAVFSNHYDNLRTFLPGPPAPAPISTPLYISNSGYADNRGIEISSTYQTTPALRLNASYSYHDLNFKSDPGMVDRVYLNSGDKWAKHAITAGSSYLISDNVTANVSGYYYSKQPAMNMPAYLKLDSNVSWQVLENMEVVAGVDNLADNTHPEYSAQLYGEATEVPRLYYLTVKLDF